MQGGTDTVLAWDLNPTEGRNATLTAAEGASAIIQQAANTMGLKIIADYCTSVE